MLRSFRTLHLAALLLCLPQTSVAEQTLITVDELLQVASTNHCRSIHQLGPSWQIVSEPAGISGYHWRRSAPQMALTDADALAYQEQWGFDRPPVAPFIYHEYTRQLVSLKARRIITQRAFIQNRLTHEEHDFFRSGCVERVDWLVVDERHQEIPGS